MPAVTSVLYGCRVTRVDRALRAATAAVDGLEASSATTSSLLGLRIVCALPPRARRCLPERAEVASFGNIGCVGKGDQSGVRILLPLCPSLAKGESPDGDVDRGLTMGSSPILPTISFGGCGRQRSVVGGKLRRNGYFTSESESMLYR